MSLFLISFVLIGLVMAGMAIGVMAGRGPLKGSCGGMGALGIDTACDICGGNPQRCEEETRGDDAEADAKMFYPADK
ncbi:MAG: (Na+)-NQR maturation NqrM [Proteobacteria bacterium]|nr:(Na+)-NQR maturation NqrM [Pseudomonadota bacterium]